MAALCVHVIFVLLAQLEQGPPPRGRRLCSVGHLPPRFTPEPVEAPGALDRIVRARSFERELVLLGTDGHYVHTAADTLRNLHAVGVAHVMTIVLQRSLCDELVALFAPAGCAWSTLFASGGSGHSTSGQLLGKGSGVARRHYLLHFALEARLNVLQLDLDTVFFDNPYVALHAIIPPGGGGLACHPTSQSIANGGLLYLAGASERPLLARMMREYLARLRRALDDPIAEAGRVLSVLGEMHLAADVLRAAPNGTAAVGGGGGADAASGGAGGAVMFSAEEREFISRTIGESIGNEQNTAHETIVSAIVGDYGRGLAPKSLRAASIAVATIVKEGRRSRGRGGKGMGEARIKALLAESERLIQRSDAVQRRCSAALRKRHQPYAPAALDGYRQLACGAHGLREELLRRRDRTGSWWALARPADERGPPCDHGCGVIALLPRWTYTMNNELIVELKMCAHVNCGRRRAPANGRLPDRRRLLAKGSGDGAAWWPLVAAHHLDKDEHRLLQARVLAQLLPLQSPADELAAAPVAIERAPAHVRARLHGIKSVKVPPGRRPAWSVAFDVCAKLRARGFNGTYPESGGRLANYSPGFVKDHREKWAVLCDSGPAATAMDDAAARGDATPVRRSYARMRVTAGESRWLSCLPRRVCELRGGPRREL